MRIFLQLNQQKNNTNQLEITTVPINTSRLTLKVDVACVGSY